MRVLVFDLDDTLYPESTYVWSGFRAVASYLSKKFDISEEEALRIMKADLRKNGRGKTFDRILELLGARNASNVSKLIGVYRSHRPILSLYPDARHILGLYATVPKYLVTDGNRMVQRIKCETLQLRRYFDRILLTSAHGIQHAKPSAYCFQKVARLEGVPPGQVVCIGDNPAKDFVNLKKEGFRTVRVLRGAYRDLKLEPRFEAERSIRTLYELPGIIERFN